MDLVLSVVADPQGANMLKHTKLFTPAGGSVGRADSNDWVLPDPERVVSSKHALITFNNSQYFLTDQSTNGTYHNQGDNPLGKGNQVPLQDGDIIGIGDYQLKVSIRRAQAESGVPAGLGDADFLDNSDRTTFSAAAAAKMQNQAEAQQLDSWLEPGSTGSSSNTGEWGYVGGANQAVGSDESLLSPDPASADPMAAFGSSASSGFGVGQDPLAAFTGTSAAAPTASGSQWSDDDWWKDGSEQDHAPADRHAMHFAAQQASSADIATAPEPSRPAAPAPQPAMPPPAVAQKPPPADNPFADSFAAMQGQQVEGAPGFDVGTQAGNPFSAASQSFSQVSPQQPPSGEQQRPVQRAATQKALQSDVPATTASEAASVGQNALAAGLGLNLSPAQLQQVDQQTAAIVQETVTRLIDLLRARTSIKNELRVQRTMIQTEANNPLKFSATAADALSAMFAGNGAFMAPQQAVQDSFDDLSDHQVAVLAGMRAGYDAMLKFFNPENIERRVGNQGGVFASKNAKNWEGFAEMYRELLKDPEACYRRLFGEEFATTYENQLSELKNARTLKN
ncbi:type VI secretion system-associated FHA domain protein TagH [Microbulbifer marinus]|uniref:FHA domain protein n=1 Tax=Microbulbifer marinus TaxID=658218 RepID=A0A1H3ZI20_9GAMM|nr:type VI secretion system-associated FHA domain protein TagH [Microbulbifer marinus]SEA23305.1 FHA domain protein [Microbulbifer marinus]